jgi:hypothetical protein
VVANTVFTTFGFSSRNEYSEVCASVMCKNIRKCDYLGMTQVDNTWFVHGTFICQTCIIEGIYFILSSCAHVVANGLLV